MREGIKVFIFTIFLLLLFSQAEGRIRPYWELRFSDIDKQSSEFSCGVAALATLFTYYYDIPIKEEEIIDEFFKKMMEEKRGISFLDMKAFALSKGFVAQGYKLNFTGLVEMMKKNNLPIIIHTKRVIQGKEELHFSLLIGMVDGYLVFKDTALGNMLISTDDFLSKWTGYALIIRPTDELKLVGTTEKIKKEKEEARGYVSRIYFYQNHPERFYSTPAHF